MVVTDLEEDVDLDELPSGVCVLLIDDSHHSSQVKLYLEGLSLDAVGKTIYVVDTVRYPAAVNKLEATNLPAAMVLHAPDDLGVCCGLDEVIELLDFYAE